MSEVPRRLCTPIGCGSPPGLDGWHAWKTTLLAPDLRVSILKSPPVPPLSVLMGWGCCLQGAEEMIGSSWTCMMPRWRGTWPPGPSTQICRWAAAGGMQQGSYGWLCWYLSPLSFLSLPRGRGEGDRRSTRSILRSVERWRTQSDGGRSEQPAGRLGGGGCKSDDSPGR